MSLVINHVMQWKLLCFLSVSQFGSQQPSSPLSFAKWRDICRKLIHKASRFETIQDLDTGGFAFDFWDTGHQVSPLLDHLFVETWQNDATLPSTPPLHTSCCWWNEIKPQTPHACFTHIPPTCGLCFWSDTCELPLLRASQFKWKFICIQ